MIRRLPKISKPCGVKIVILTVSVITLVTVVNNFDVIFDSVDTMDDSYDDSDGSDTDTHYMGLPYCKLNESELRGREPVSLRGRSFRTLSALFNNTWEMGGRFRPRKCKAQSRTAIIVPFSDRDAHLKAFLFNVIPKLRRQKLDFTIFVVEQTLDSRFNRGMMRNIGFIEAKKMGNFDCYVFNDVDTIMENDRNIMTCGQDKSVRHLVTGVDRDNYKLKYSTLIGGILTFTPDQFVKVNGYSNFFFMWGAEDDDMEKRIRRNGLMVKRPPTSIGYVSTLKHERDPIIASRFEILESRTKENSKKDGLNSVQYVLKMIEKRELYTWIYVSVDEKEVLKSLKYQKKKKKKSRSLKSQKKKLKRHK